MPDRIDTKDIDTKDDAQREPSPPECRTGSPRYFLLLAAIGLLTSPFPFLFFGESGAAESTAEPPLPTWLLWSLGWTTVLSFTTAWGVLVWWKDEAPGENAGGGRTGGERADG